MDYKDLLWLEDLLIAGWVLFSGTLVFVSSKQAQIWLGEAQL